jgi:hypothetical protein
MRPQFFCIAASQRPGWFSGIFLIDLPFPPSILAPHLLVFFPSNYAPP